VEIKDGLKAAMEISSIGNKYLQDSKFWEEENKKSGRTNRVIAIICNFIRLISLIF
jgi:methionyl-tRNA synthetase